MIEKRVIERKYSDTIILAVQQKKCAYQSENQAYAPEWQR